MTGSPAGLPHSGPPCSPASVRVRPWALLCTVFLFAVLNSAAACHASVAHRAARRATTPDPISVPLDAVFESPVHGYRLRYHHAWNVQQVPSQTGPLDFFILPNARLAVIAAPVQPGTTLQAYVRQMLLSYQQAQIQGLEQAGTIEVGGGQGALIRAITYVTPEGVTVAAPPSPDARPQQLLQAIYLTGGRAFIFSITWPRDDRADYPSLFRAILRTFVLSGVS